MAKAIRMHRTGGPEVLCLEDVDVGDPGPGQARVKHVAVGINFADTYFRTGMYPVPLPAGMGVEAAGVVEAVGVLGSSTLPSATASPTPASSTHSALTARNG